MKNFGLALLLLASPLAASAQTPAFPMTDSGLVISRPTQPQQPFTVAGPRGVLVGSQDGQFESWVLPVKLLSHLTIEASLQGYSVPIEVNPQSANIEVRPDRTIITYSHIGFTIRQIMFSPDNASVAPSTGPVVLFQFESPRPLDLTFRFTPEMRWMWPKRNDGIPGAEWVATSGGYYTLHMDYPDLAGAVTIPTATPGILAPYQERPQVHPLELHLHYDPTRDGSRFFPLLMAVGTTKDAASNAALGQQLQQLNSSIPALYATHAQHYKKLLADSTSIETPDKALNQAFQWGVVSIEQLKTHEFASNQDALVAGYYASGDSARPGFGWFFGRDALYTLYAVNGFGDFALSRAELEFLIARQRADGKIMHEYSQTAADAPDSRNPVDWKQFPYMYAAADATPLFLMAVRDYYRASGDLAFLQKNREAIEKAWAFETDPAHDTDHDGIYDNSQGTGWVESWPHGAMPHQEVYLALLDEQASRAYSAIASALGNNENSTTAAARAQKIAATIEQEYSNKQKGCYAFSHNLPNDPNGETDKSSTVYPAIAWWDDNSSPSSTNVGAPSMSQPHRDMGGNHQPLAHPESCLSQFASPALATDWGLRDVANTEPFYDGMSYHQGSVWPLFTGWAALAEYRGNQPLAGEQMLMQNVDLTLAQDPGAVTELLSGDSFVPFGRSTSHQLWSSAMVLTPTLRGLFGISLDAATNTITVNPHLPANWDKAEVSNVRLGAKLFDLTMDREKGRLHVQARGSDHQPTTVRLRSDLAGATAAAKPVLSAAEVFIPLPAIELSLSTHTLPTPGARPSQVKLVSFDETDHTAHLVVEGLAGTASTLMLHRNKPVTPKFNGPLCKEEDPDNPHIGYSSAASSDINVPMPFSVCFPTGQGYQTLEFTLTW